MKSGGGPGALLSKVIWPYTATEVADKVTDMYAHNPNGFDVIKCQWELGIEAQKCAEIEGAMSTGPGGEITEREATLLQNTGALSAEEIRLIRGNDGKKALRERVKWLSEHIVTRLWRIDYDNVTRVKMIVELGLIGDKSSLPALIEAGGDDDEDVSYAGIHIHGAISCLPLRLESDGVGCLEVKP